MAANHKKIYRIRTGGQSGVDRAAMDFAREYGIPLCGWCPKNGWAEDYPDSPGVLLDYPELYSYRSLSAFLDRLSHLNGKPMLTVSGIKDVPQILSWLNSLPDGIELCVGGPRASECSEAYDLTIEVLHSIFCHDTW